MLAAHKTSLIGTLYKLKQKCLLTAASVYLPVASDPWELISAMRRQPRCRGRPTSFRPFTTPEPGTTWALTMSDQDAILNVPPEKRERHTRSEISHQKCIKQESWLKQNKQHTNSFMLEDFLLLKLNSYKCSFTRHSWQLHNHKASSPSFILQKHLVTCLYYSLSH